MYEFYFHLIQLCKKKSTSQKTEDFINGHKKHLKFKDVFAEKASVTQVWPLKASRKSEFNLWDATP